MLQAIEVLPAAGKHAIEVMALAVEWDRKMSPEMFAAIEELYRTTDSLQRLLPRIEKVPGFSVHLGNDGVSVNADDIGGLMLSQQRDDGSQAWALSIRPDLVACSCFVYDRWASVSRQALSIMAPIVGRVLESGCLIQAIGLQYQDSFRVLSSSPPKAAERLFRKENVWLSPYVWQMDGPWHIHQGWFSGGPDGRRVSNLLNIDFVAEEQAGVVRINGQHRVQAVDFGGKGSRPLQPSDLPVALDFLHLDNKKALHHLLSENVCRQIGLTVPESK